MKKILAILIILLPWRLRRWLLIKIWKYEIHSTAKIGFSYIYPKHLIMREYSRIGHFNIAMHLDLIILGRNSIIARSNWITGFPIKTASKHFSHQISRQSELIIGDESAVTKHHHLDCTNQIHIGNFVTIAGYRSQFLTHSIDVYENRQHSRPIKIGDYCFISTHVIVLGGSKLPAYSVLSAGAVLTKEYQEEWKLYAGVPAKIVKEISKESKYFYRNKGFVY